MITISCYRRQDQARQVSIANMQSHCYSTYCLFHNTCCSFVKNEAKNTALWFLNNDKYRILYNAIRKDMKIKFNSAAAIKKQEKQASIFQLPYVERKEILIKLFQFVDICMPIWLNLDIACKYVRCLNKTQNNLALKLVAFGP